MECLKPYILDVDVEALLVKTANCGVNGISIESLIILDESLLGPLESASLYGWLEVQVDDEIGFELVAQVAQLDVAKGLAMLRHKGAHARLSHIGSILVTLRDAEYHCDNTLPRYTSGLKLSDFTSLALDCIEAEWEQHLIITARYMPYKSGSIEARLEHIRKSMNHKIWQSGIELGRSWCKLLATFPEFKQCRTELLAAWRNLGAIGKIDPETGNGSTLYSVRELEERLEGLEILSPPISTSPVKAKLSSEDRERAIQKIIRRFENPTRDFIAEAVGCGAGTVTSSPAFQLMKKRQNAEKASRLRKGGHAKQRSLASVKPPAKTQEEEKFWDEQTDEDCNFFKQTDTEFGTRGGSWDLTDT